MSLLSCQNVCVSFAQREIIRNASFEVNKGDRIGLIGANGTGKTTLFRVLSDQLEPSDGQLVKASHTVIGFVEQHACAGSQKTIYDEIMTVFSDLLAMERRLTELGGLIRIDNFLEHFPAHIEKLREGLLSLREREAQIRRELAGQEDYGERIEALSEKLRELDEKLGVKKDE